MKLLAKIASTCIVLIFQNFPVHGGMPPRPPYKECALHTACVPTGNNISIAIAFSGPPSNFCLATPVLCYRYAGYCC